MMSDKSIESKIAYYQERLLEQARYYAASDGRTISTAIEQAFRAVPRHRFISRYRNWSTNEWHTVTPETLLEHLSMLYSNNAIGLYGDDESMPSTISQPSLVLSMLELLQLAPGNRVFEVGAGSGWNAGLMGQLVAPEGHVYSVEIIPSMAQEAANNVAALGLTNVTILVGDAGDCYAPGAPYDRAIFTAGATDLPLCFYEQLTANALMLLVFKLTEGGETLFLLRKEADHFRSLESMTVGFVPMTGAHAAGSQPQLLTELPAWERLQTAEVDRQAFWWGGHGEGGLLWRTRGVRSFLAIVEPWFTTFRVPTRNSEMQKLFGLWDREGGSLTLAYHDHLVTYGNMATNERLRMWLQRWIDLGMPAADSFQLQIYPADATVIPGENEWLVRRSESQFLWQLPTRAC